MHSLVACVRFPWSCFHVGLSVLYHVLCCVLCVVLYDVLCVVLCCVLQDGVERSHDPLPSCHYTHLVMALG